MIDKYALSFAADLFVVSFSVLPIAEKSLFRPKGEVGGKEKTNICQRNAELTICKSFRFRLHRTFFLQRTSCQQGVVLAVPQETRSTITLFLSQQIPFYCRSCLLLLRKSPFLLRINVYCRAVQIPFLPRADIFLANEKTPCSVGFKVLANNGPVSASREDHGVVGDVTVPFILFRQL